MVEREYKEAAYLGIGFNSLTGEFRNSAIKVNGSDLGKNRDLETEVLQKVYFSYEHITSETMLAKSLGISGSVYNNMGAGIGFSDIFQANAKSSFSAKAKFLTERNWQSSNTYILVKCVVENEKYRIKNPVLTSEASEILAGKDGVERFREKFGDEFVVGFSTGGEYFALIEASSSDGASKTNFVADIRAEVEHHLQKLSFEVDHEAGINIGGEMNNFQRNKNMNLSINVYRAGCQDIGNAFVRGIEQMVQEISVLPAYVKKTGGVKFTSILSDYGIIVSDENNQIVSKELKRQKDAIFRLINKKKEDLSQLQKIEQKLEKVDYDSPSLKEAKNEIEQRLYEIDKYARQCIENPRLIDEDTLRDLLTWN